MTKFEKVSQVQFAADGGNAESYGKVILPKRGTSGSAGYDFFASECVTIKAGQSVKVLTGIRCAMPHDRCLLIFPRSSLGFKYRLALDNTVGVIDSDYCGAANEGHIMIKMTNNSGNDLIINEGAAFAQGIFINYGLTDDDDVNNSRVGGFGSTNK